MYDVFFRAVDKSDPVVLSLLEPKLLSKRPRKTFPADVASLLVNPEETSQPKKLMMLTTVTIEQ
jgi:hypothetical protein